MKNIVYALIAMSTLFIACTKPSNPFDTVVTVMVDETDSLPNYPTAKSLLAPFKLTEYPWQGIQIKVTAITDKDVNNTETVSLEKADRLTGNITIRRAKIERFAEQLQAQLATFDSTRNFPHSIIFRSIARQAALLATVNAPRRYVLVYSNLLENSEVNFYNPQTLALLESEPALIEKQLVADAPLTPLNGVDISFLYAPASYHQNNIYMPIVRFYEHVYKAHRAQVHVGTQFTLP